MAIIRENTSDISCSEPERAAWMAAPPSTIPPSHARHLKIPALFDRIRSNKTIYIYSAQAFYPKERISHCNNFAFLTVQIKHSS